MPRFPSRLLAALGMVVGFQAGTALADAIDGDSCHADGRRLTIHGPDITTPAGNALKGDYDRHHFSYVVPAGEAGSGGTVSMSLMGELRMRLKPVSGEEQDWRRCGKPVS
jgi:hypothetical protein